MLFLFTDSYAASMKQPFSRCFMDAASGKLYLPVIMQGVVKKKLGLFIHFFTAPYPVIGVIDIFPKTARCGCV